MTKEEIETQKAVKAAMGQHKAMVIGGRVARQEDCMREVQETLKKYDCQLFPQALITPAGIQFMIECHPNPKEGEHPGMGVPSTPLEKPDAPDKKRKKNKK